MYSVYRDSYCNISATAPNDGIQGLHSKRDPQDLWETEVNLNLEGIPRELSSSGRKQQQSELGRKMRIQRCKLLDASFWERIVDDAPVNRRAW
jgi:hypothetical protein